jgi:hypothetical protein
MEMAQEQVRLFPVGEQQAEVPESAVMQPVAELRE